jgi:hypothetical protein
MSTKTVCDTQDDFNHAFRDAVKYVNKKDKPKLWVQLVALGIVLIIVVWALVLAMRVSGGADQKVHLVLALVFAPFYIIAYYLSGSA